MVVCVPDFSGGRKLIVSDLLFEEVFRGQICGLSNKELSEAKLLEEMLMTTSQCGP
jgi:hypothetical protein